ncbi:MAG: tetratricopeptide repeat protein, partial [Lentisphaerae bacterium]|nr:tetratricopeptide repeat protein [Lentisphaerota bacterium]
YMPNDPETAVRVLQAGAKRRAGDFLIRFALAHVYALQDRTEDALRLFGAVYEDAAREDALDQLSETFYLHYGMTCEQAGDHARAESVFEQGIALYPKSHQALNYLAYMWAERGINLDKALAYVRRALDEDPDNGAYLDTLGWVYYKQHAYEPALDALRKAARALPGDPVIAGHVADVLEALNRPAEAAAYRARAATNAPPGAPPHSPPPPDAP